ncbi:MAG: LPS assembly lipoprotein LptE [Flavipsychrobacter sp.]
MRRLLLLVPIFLLFCSGCGVYSFTGATIDGKTLNMHMLDNRARNVVPTLSQNLTSMIRQRILTQTGLTSVNTENADYDISGYITGYEVTVSGVQNTQTASQNRLTISVTIVFKNRKNSKADFTQSFSRFADFSANQTVQSVEGTLIETIGNLLAQDIFNKAFVNW